MLIPMPNRWEAEATGRPGAGLRLVLNSASRLEPSRLYTKVEAMPFCTNCGHENPEGSNFCGQCGSALIPGAARAATPKGADRRYDQGDARDG